MSILFERGRGRISAPNWYSSPKTDVSLPRRFPANVNKKPVRPKWKPVEKKAPPARPKKKGRNKVRKKVQRPTRYVIRKDIKPPKVTSDVGQITALKSNALRIGSRVIQRVAGPAGTLLDAISVWESPKPNQELSDFQRKNFDLLLGNFDITSDLGIPVEWGAADKSGETVRLSGSAAEEFLRLGEVESLPELYVSEAPVRVDTSRLSINVVTAVPELAQLPAPGQAVSLSPESTIHVGSPHKIITDFIIESLPEIDQSLPDLERLEIDFKQELDKKGEITFVPTEITVPIQPRLEPAIKENWEEIAVEIPVKGRPKVVARQKRLTSRQARSNKRQRDDQKSRMGRLYLGIKKFVDKTIGSDAVEVYFILTDNLISEPLTKYRPKYKKGYISFYDKEVGRWRYKAKTPKAALEGFQSGFLHLNSEGLAKDLIYNAIEDRVIGEVSRKGKRGWDQMQKQFGTTGREIGFQFGPTL